jgi:hypothetical protein
MPITETIQDVNQIIIRTALMHRDTPAKDVLDRAISENFPGAATKEVLLQAEINSIIAARERQGIKDAAKLIATHPDTQGQLFDDEPPAVWVPSMMGGKPYHRVTLADGLAWARSFVQKQEAEVEAHSRMLSMAKLKLKDAEAKLQEHEAACAWCARHGLDPSTVTYAEVHQHAQA